MTKTIEFIKKEIENSKKFVDKAIRYNLTIYFKNETEKLQILEQIKCELEAWEEIKKYIVVEEGYVNLYDSYYDIISLKEDCIDEAKNEEEGISVSIIKKALEVKDE